MRFYLLYLMARLNRLLGRPNIALQYLRRATNYSSRARRELAWLLSQTNNYDEALIRFREIVALNPSDAWAAIGLANTLQGLGRHPEAVAAFEQARVLSPDDPLLHYNVAESYIACGQKQDALAAYRRVVRLNPNDAQAWGNLGALLGELGHWSDAVECDKKAVQLDPSVIHTANLGVALMELQRFAEAEEAFRMALRKEDSTELAVQLAIAIAEQGRPAESLELLQRVRSAEPNHWLAARLMIGVLVNLTRFADALEVGAALVEEFPQLAASHAAVGWVQLQQGAANAAYESYARGLEIDPQDSESVAGTVAALVMQHRFSDARDVLQQRRMGVPELLEQNPSFGQYLDRVELTD